MNYGEANLSAEQQTTSKNSRLPRKNGNQSWSTCAQATARKRPEPVDTSALLRSGLRTWFMTVHLRASQEFQKVYRKGKRYDGTLITAFDLPNKLSHNRFGVTASRKALGKAVNRNRARRLLKETFRLKTASLCSLRAKYDWVLNAKRELSAIKLQAALDEFEKLISRVAQEEAKPSSLGERQ